MTAKKQCFSVIAEQYEFIAEHVCVHNSGKAFIIYVCSLAKALGGGHKVSLFPMRYWQLTVSC